MHIGGNVMKKILVSLLAVSALAGCASNAVQVVEPTTARPAPAPVVPQNNGAIFQQASFRPLFEDRRARHVGDTLVVSIVERTSASSKTANSNSRAAQAQVGITAVPGVSARALKNLDTQASANSKSEDKDAASNDNLFTGTIAVTVVEELPNGNLVVSGSKQVGVNGETDTLRFSGVVNPMTIQPGNVVMSNQVADARLETVSRSSIDGARIAGFLGRFFLSFIPFR